MDYDILIVGAGITAATICALAKHKYKICVVDVRNHIGGNCYDYKSGNSYIHSYGPHIFHSHNKEVVNFLSDYTDWLPIDYSVMAEIFIDGQLKRVPFPYSEETEKAIGRKLNDEEIINLFFKDYSEKMWHMDFNQLPDAIKNRVPKRLKKSNYFPGQFQALPKKGYSKMMEKMFDGVGVILNVDKDFWKQITAKKIIYCGRIDLIEPEAFDIKLPYIDLDITFSMENDDDQKAAIHFCHLKTPCCRKVNYGILNEDDMCKIVSHEKPFVSKNETINPVYPFCLTKHMKEYDLLKRKIQNRHPNMHFLGRLGAYEYIDMDIAIEKTMTFCKEKIYGT